MTPSRYPHITDELLSAYIDNSVTEDEKALIEAAISSESTIAWRLETLRYTVNLLNSLPNVALPRSFVLSESQVAHGTAQPTMVAQTNPRRINPRVGQSDRVGPGGFWQGWRDFWQVGNLFLRNAAAASLAIFLVLSASNFFVTHGTSPSRQPIGLTQSAPTTLAYGAVATATENVQVASDRLPRPMATPIAPQVTGAQSKASPPLAKGDAASGAPTEQAAVTLAAKSQAQQVAPATQSGPAQAGGGQGGQVAVNGDQSAPPAAPSDAAEFAPEAPSVAAASARQPSQNDAQFMRSSTSAITVSAAENRVDATPASEMAMTTTAAMTQSLTLITATNQLTTNQLTTNQTATIQTATIGTAVTQTMTSTLFTKTQSAQNMNATPIALTRLPATPTGAPTWRDSRLQLAQFVFALITLIFAFLWWRSRLGAGPMART